MKHEVSVFTALIHKFTGYELPDHLVMLAFITAVFAIISPLIKRSLSEENPGKVQLALELIVGTLRNSLKEIVGHKGLSYIGIVGTFAFVIFVCNFSGIVPGLQPPTANVNVTLGLALMVFGYYNFHGLKELGIPYFKQFLGPVWWLIPLFIVVEIISHVARPLSLTLRLFGNIFGEHTATMQIFGLVPFAIPLAMLGLGIFGSAVQTLIFVVLTMVYLGGAVSEHH